MTLIFKGQAIVGYAENETKAKEAIMKHLDKNPEHWVNGSEYWWEKYGWLTNIEIWKFREVKEIAEALNV